MLYHRSTVSEKGETISISELIEREVKKGSFDGQDTVLDQSTFSANTLLTCPPGQTLNHKSKCGRYTYWKSLLYSLLFHLIMAAAIDHLFILLLFLLSRSRGRNGKSEKKWISLEISWSTYFYRYIVLYISVKCKYGVCVIKRFISKFTENSPYEMAYLHK